MSSKTKETLFVGVMAILCFVGFAWRFDWLPIDETLGAILGIIGYSMLIGYSLWNWRKQRRLKKAAGEGSA